MCLSTLSLPIPEFPRSLDPIFIVNYYKKWVKTSLAYSKIFIQTINFLSINFVQSKTHKKYIRTKIINCINEIKFVYSPFIITYFRAFFSRVVDPDSVVLVGSGSWSCLPGFKIWSGLVLEIWSDPDPGYFFMGRIRVTTTLPLKTPLHDNLDILFIQIKCLPR